MKCRLTNIELSRAKIRLRKIFWFFFYWRPKNKVGDVNSDTSSTFFDTDLPNLSPPLSLVPKVAVVAKSTGPDIPRRLTFKSNLISVHFWKTQALPQFQSSSNFKNLNFHRYKKQNMVGERKSWMKPFLNGLHIWSVPIEGEYRQQCRWRAVKIFRSNGEKNGNLSRAYKIWQWTYYATERKRERERKWGGGTRENIQFCSLF